MAYSTQRVTSDGTLVLLDISIEYFDRSEIAVLFNGVIGTYSWAWVGDTEKKISFSPAVPNTVEVMLVRTTDLAAVRHMFTLGAQFTTQSLDEDLLQILHIAQEAKENATIEEVFHNLNMHGYRIINIGDGIDPQDAPSMAQMVVHNATIVAYRDAAAASAVAAAASAAAALVSETNAAASTVIQVNAGNTNAVLKTGATGSAVVPSGTTAQRDAVPTTGMFRLNLTLGRFEGYTGSAWTTLSGEVTLATVQTLQNKVLDSSNTLPSKLIPFTGSIGSNILTGSLAATGLDFRSATLTSGAITPVNVGALSINIPATSSLGLTTALGTNRIVFLVAYNAGSPVLCVVNASGLVLDETGVISPTTIGAASNSKNVVYSASAVSANSPYRVVGFVDALFTTGTGWNGLSLTQGAGGQSLISLQGRLWQSVSGSRALSTLYTNNTGREIFVSVGCGTSGTSTAAFFCDGLQVGGATAGAASISGLTCSWAVPAGSTYQVTNTAGTITFWVELR